MLVKSRLVAYVLSCLFLCGVVVAGQPAHEHAKSKTGATESRGAREKRDGQHDFDFSIGTWKTHVSRMLRPLTGSTTWTEYDGISVVRKVWSGRANLLELEVDGSAGHIEGAGLRLYDPQSRQWSLNWVNSADGILNRPMVGGFQAGQGEFFDQESFGGRAIFVRNRFKDITPNSCRFEQAFSEDGGKTWETNWVMTFTRARGQ
jgi:hypothetical protein